MENLSKQVGFRIHMRRQQLRLTQEKLAELADLTTQTMSTAETGRKEMRLTNFAKLCTALNVSADYLLFGEISQKDFAILSDKVSHLSPEQYRHLEDIIDSYIAAVTPNHKNEV